MSWEAQGGLWAGSEERRHWAVPREVPPLPLLRAGVLCRGTLMVAEVASRFEDIRAFMSGMAQLGFKSISKVCPQVLPVLGTGCSGPPGTREPREGAHGPWQPETTLPAPAAGQGGTAQPGASGERAGGWWQCVGDCDTRGLRGSGMGSGGPRTHKGCAGV